mmetsp:Transcript_14170/g.33072  ORF Transcript_14170/g.33072 Transcript_14170/m.33072 type:complete len:211 (-) Transcript_14170:3511-4143(-)
MGPDEAQGPVCCLPLCGGKRQRPGLQAERRPRRGQGHPQHPDHRRGCDRDASALQHRHHHQCQPGQGQTWQRLVDICHLARVLCVRGGPRLVRVHRGAGRQRVRDALRLPRAAPRGRRRHHPCVLAQARPRRIRQANHRDPRHVGGRDRVAHRLLRHHVRDPGHRHVRHGGRDLCHQGRCERRDRRCRARRVHPHLGCRGHHHNRGHVQD